jgi:hypothetical protein
MMNVQVQVLKETLFFRKSLFDDVTLKQHQNMVNVGC